MMVPITPDTLTALFIGIILGMFLVALMLFVYGLITSHRAYKHNNQVLRKGLQTMREQYESEAHQL